jgi:L,D-transpeptidase catalytic domain
MLTSRLVLPASHRLRSRTICGALPFASHSQTQGPKRSSPFCQSDIVEGAAACVSQTDGSGRRQLLLGREHFVASTELMVMTCGPKAYFFAFLLVVPMFAGLAGTSDHAEAHTRSDPATGTKRKLSDAGPVLALVSLSKQRIWVYGSTGLIAESAVSTGMAGHRTPTGVFSVLQKSKFHRSNLYWNAPMPYMQRITWSGITFHAGIVPGYPASHGCIRLPHRFAVELWGMTRIGTRVVVVPDAATVVTNVRSQLPVPKLTMVSVEDDKVSEKPLGSNTAKLVKIAEAPATATSPTTRLLNPLERARLIRGVASAEKIAKAKAAASARQTAALKAAAAKSAAAALRASESAFAIARARRDAAAGAIERTTTPESTERAKRAFAMVEARFAEAQRENEDARAHEATETAEAMAAARVESDAEAASREAAAKLKLAERGTEPISILVSKKTSRLYIRQSWAPIYEAPIPFKDVEQPVGTHLYLAVAADGDGETLRWLSVSLPIRGPGQVREGGRQHSREPLASGRAPRPPLAQKTAANPLERFELTEEAKAFIAERLWAGASLIVSDEGLSNEAGTYTDFIVLTR